MSAATLNFPETTKAIAFWVSGMPKGQPRPRAFARALPGGRVMARMYEAGTAEAWKADVVRAAEPHRPAQPLDGPVEVSIEFHLARPKRLYRKCDRDGPVWCDSKPDRDNADKAVLDALKVMGWFRDDAQVCAGVLRKVYHAKNGVPGAWIEIRALSSDPPDDGWRFFQKQKQGGGVH